MSRTRLHATLLLGVLLAACATNREPAQTQFSTLSFLAFGDTGYHYDYLEPKVLDKALSPEQYLEGERKKWSGDKLPIEDFKPAPLHRLESTGGMVMASGLEPVAKAMRNYCEDAGCAFAVMLGDNIYPNGATLGADGHDDATRFRTLFTEPFGTLGARQPGFAIYPTLGNHDWRTSRAGAEAEVAFLRENPPFKMGGLFYRVLPPAAHGQVEIFVIDTHVMLAGTTVYEDKLDSNGSELPTDELEQPDAWAKPSNDAERGMQQWLDDALRSSTARWKIVIGHHPLWSSSGGKFEQARALRRLVLPTLCRYADAYLAGHEHTLEVHTDDCSQGLGQATDVPLLQVVSGAGAKQRGVNRLFAARQLRKYPQLRSVTTTGMVWGFTHLTLDADQLTVRVITTPNDGRGTPVETHVSKYRHRSSVQ
jgi:tartrate-resistant acid phosphatase type 5